MVDCIYMTKEYVKDIKNNHYQEYICGVYEEGRYAWVLKNIMPISSLKAKGQLGIWNYYTEEEIMAKLAEIKYGWVDKDKHKKSAIDASYSDNYRLQSPTEIIKNKVGVCWDQVELERYYFKSNDLNMETFFLVHYDNDKCPTHTFLTYEKNNKYYWFEHAWEKYQGIHEYSTKKELLNDVINKFIKTELNNNYNKNNLILKVYTKPKSNLSVQEFYKHCEQGTIIDINILEE